MEKDHNFKLVPLAIIIAGLLIAGAIYWRPATPTMNQDDTRAAQLSLAKEALKQMTPPSAADHLKGQLPAPVTIVEYTDLECPFCKAFQWTMDELMTKYGTSSQPVWIFRHFPLNIHPKAIKEAEAAECAGKLGGEEKFWQYVDKIYEITPSNNGLDLTLLPKVAKDLGLDQAKFSACLDKQETKAIVESQLAEAQKIKADGTPFVVVINSQGEKILPFFEPVPKTWSAEAKQIVNELLESYQTNIQKLR